MTRRYHTPDNKQRLGPVTTEQLRQLALSGAIRPGHMVMREGGGKWVPAAKVKGLLPETPARSVALRPQTAAAAPDLPPVAGLETATPLGPAKRRRRGPIIALAGCLVLALVLCAGGGLVGVTLGWWPKGHGDSHGAPAAGKDDTGKATGGPTASTQADLNDIYRAYEGNEAAADAKYLQKRVQFTFTPRGIDKDPSGGYCAWSNTTGLAPAEKWGRHMQCHFSAYQSAALADFRVGQSMTIRGVCVGKTGMVRTSNGYIGAYGGWSDDPVIEFKDCELVGKPEERPPPPSIEMHR